MALATLNSVVDKTWVLVALVRCKVVDSASDLARHRRVDTTSDHLFHFADVKEDEHYVRS
jgi:hypothetical protein